VITAQNYFNTYPIAMLIFTYAPVIALAQSHVIDKTISSIINNTLKDDECSISGFDRHNADLNGDGKPEVIALYSLSADNCNSGGGTWSRSERAHSHFSG
jgi:hypothetical protein